MGVPNEKANSSQDVAELGTEKTIPTRQDGTDVSTEDMTEDHTSLKTDEKSHHSHLPDSEGHVTDGDDHEDDPDEPPIRPQSTRASSVFGANIIPRNQRRGLFGQLAIIPEIERPYDYTTKTKWTITAIVALAAAAAPMGSGIFYRMSLPTLSQTQKLTHS